MIRESVQHSAVIRDEKMLYIDEIEVREGIRQHARKIMLSETLYIQRLMDQGAEEFSATKPSSAASSELNTLQHCVASTL